MLEPVGMTRSVSAASGPPATSTSSRVCPSEAPSTSARASTPLAVAGGEPDRVPPDDRRADDPGLAEGRRPEPAPVAVEGEDLPGGVDHEREPAHDDRAERRGGVDRPGAERGEVAGRERADLEVGRDHEDGRAGRRRVAQPPGCRASARRRRPAAGAGWSRPPGGGARRPSRRRRSPRRRRPPGSASGSASTGRTAGRTGRRPTGPMGLDQVDAPAAGREPGGSCRSAAGPRRGAPGGRPAVAAGESRTSILIGVGRGDEDGGPVDFQADRARGDEVGRARAGQGLLDEAAGAELVAGQGQVAAVAQEGRDRVARAGLDPPGRPGDPDDRPPADGPRGGVDPPERGPLPSLGLLGQHGQLAERLRRRQGAPRRAQGPDRARACRGRRRGRTAPTGPRPR